MSLQDNVNALITKAVQAGSAPEAVNYAQAASLVAGTRHAMEGWSKEITSLLPVIKEAL